MEEIENTRKRLIFRSWHRGTKEMDLLLGSFAEAHVPGFDEGGLAAYEEILGYNDPDLYNWITGVENPPAKALNPVFEMLLGHVYKKSAV